MFTHALLALAALTPLVNAHGWMRRVVIDGTEYPGPTPNAEDGQQYAIRQINSVDPVKGANNSFLACGQDAQNAALLADAAPGSTVGFGWNNGEGGPWVHNIGPVMTYMASCGNVSCTEFDANQAEFFKIDEKGRLDNGNWTLSEYNDDVNSLLNVTLPTNLPAGEYLVRHEILALHNGNVAGGAEFYPACIQVRLSAPSNANVDAVLPSGNETVTFPGGYSDTDPGILDVNIYDPSAPYTFPGPDVVNNSEDSTGNNGNGSGNGGDGTPTSSDTSAPTPTSGSGSGCGGGNNSSRKMKRVVKRIIRQEVRKVASKAKRSGTKQVQVQQVAKRDVHHHRVRTNSRVMRGLNLD